MKKTAICIFLLVFLLLSLGTAGLEVTKINIRFALMVRDMADCGLRLFPTMNGVEYGDYPSLWILLSRLASLNGRFLNLWTLSLPSLLLGAYTVAVTYCSGEMRGKGRGIIAAALLLTAPQFVDLMSGFGLDVPVMACGATMLYLLQTERSERRLCIAFAALFCISFCVRGPMGSAVFSVACGGALLFGERRLLRRFISAGLAAALLCCGLWYCAVLYAGGAELWNWFLMCQIGSRFGGFAVLSNLGNAFFSYAPLTFLCLGAFLFRRDSGVLATALRLAALEKRDFAVKTQLEGKLGHRKYLALTVEERGK